MTDELVEAGKDVPATVPTLKDANDAVVAEALQRDTQAVVVLKKEIEDLRSKHELEVARRKRAEEDSEKWDSLCQEQLKAMRKQQVINAEMASKLNTAQLKLNRLESQPDVGPLQKEIADLRAQVSAGHRAISDLEKQKYELAAEVGRQELKLRTYQQHIHRIENAAEMMQQARDKAERERNAAESRASIAELDQKALKDLSESQAERLRKCDAALDVCAKALKPVVPADQSVWTMIADAKGESA